MWRGFSSLNSKLAENRYGGVGWCNSQNYSACPSPISSKFTQQGGRKKKDGKTLVCFPVLLCKLTTDRSEASTYLIKSTIL